MRHRSFREALRGVLTEGEMSRVATAFDVIGDIAVLEIPRELEKKKEQIAKTLLSVHKNIRVVLRKKTARKDSYRLRGYEHLAGERRTTTLHRESGCTFALDVTKTYFSVREGTERLRVAEQVRERERVLVMFSGVGPFAIVIAKRKAVDVVTVEINPVAYTYMVQNVRTNRVMHRVTPLLGDVKKMVPMLSLFDRVIMPLPHSAHMFLGVAIDALRKGGVLHFYSIQPEKDLFSEPIKQLERATREKNRTVKILAKRKVLPYAPRVYKVCVDAIIL